MSLVQKSVDIFSVDIYTISAYEVVGNSTQTIPFLDPF